MHQKQQHEVRDWGPFHSQIYAKPLEEQPAHSKHSADIC